MFFAKPLQRSNLCASHRQRRWLTHGELNPPDHSTPTCRWTGTAYHGLQGRPSTITPRHTKSAIAGLTESRETAAAICSSLRRRQGDRAKGNVNETDIQEFCRDQQTGSVYFSRVARTYRVFIDELADGAEQILSSDAKNLRVMPS